MSIYVCKLSSYSLSLTKLEISGEYIEILSIFGYSCHSHHPDSQNKAFGFRVQYSKGKIFRLFLSRFYYSLPYLSAEPDNIGHLNVDCNIQLRAARLEVILGGPFPHFFVCEMLCHWFVMSDCLSQSITRLFIRIFEFRYLGFSQSC